MKHKGEEMEGKGGVDSHVAVCRERERGVCAMSSQEVLKSQCGYRWFPNVN